ncbi:MAG: zinc ribbon domain-containing protein [Myxococcota bacterium]|nr:zinc ribbon domain-containing protein [Myxococcota bacterium]
MPIYEYHCEACNHDFEVIQKVNDAPIRMCEACGNNEAKRKVSRTSFILKGGGWYAQGYGSASSTASSSSDKSSNSTASSSSDKSSNSAASSSSEKCSSSKAANE